MILFSCITGNVHPGMILCLILGDFPDIVDNFYLLFGLDCIKDWDNH